MGQPAADTASVLEDTSLDLPPTETFSIDGKEVTKKEFDKGHVEGAINITHTEISNRLSDIPRNKDVIIYCRSGVRAKVAAKVLSKNKYEQLFHLYGDMILWQKNNRPIAVVNQ